MPRAREQLEAAHGGRRHRRRLPRSPTVVGRLAAADRPAERGDRLRDALDGRLRAAERRDQGAAGVAPRRRQHAVRRREVPVLHVGAHERDRLPRRGVRLRERDVPRGRRRSSLVGPPRRLRRLRTGPELRNPSPDGLFDRPELPVPVHPRRRVRVDQRLRVPPRPAPRVLALRGRIRPPSVGEWPSAQDRIPVRLLAAGSKRTDGGRVRRGRRDRPRGTQARPRRPSPVPRASSRP